MGTASMTTSQWRDFSEAVLRSLPEDLDPNVAQDLIKNEDSLRKALREALVPPRQDDEFTIESYDVDVDYEMNVDDVVRLGRYYWVNDEITEENFPVVRKGSAHIRVDLFHFNRRIASGDAIFRVNRSDCRSADLRELLAFSRQHPNVQCRFPIVALDSKFAKRDGHLTVPCLGGTGEKRDLGLRWFENIWPDNYRFAAVLK